MDGLRFIVRMEGTVAAQYQSESRKEDDVALVHSFLIPTSRWFAVRIDSVGCYDARASERASE